MVKGKIDWFGGINKKTNKINDFGFLTIEDENKSLKFYRDEISIELQNIFEKDRKKGNGYLVDCEVQNSNKNSQRAIKIKPITGFGLAISSRELISQYNISHFTKEINTYNKGKIIEFISKDYTKNGSEAIVLKKLKIEEIPTSVIDFFEKKINSLDEKEVLNICNNIHNDILVISNKFRQKLKSSNINLYTRFCKQYFQSIKDNSQDKIWLEYVEFINSSKDHQEILKLLEVYMCNERDTRKSIEFILNKIRSLKTSQRQEFIRKSAKYNSNPFLEDKDLIFYLAEYDVTTYINVLQEILRSDNKLPTRNKIQDIITPIKSCCEDKKNNIWDKIPYLQENLEYKGYLWDIAPSKYKKELIKSRYSLFFESVNQFKQLGYKQEEFIKKGYKNFYNFDDNEQKLISKWTNGSNDDATKARMCSARGAENLVRYFYEKTTKNKPDDISIEQVTKVSTEWKIADIRINSNQLIDVKNARKDINSNVYSRFHIPKFKRDRSMNDVIISAVLSDYISMKEIESQENSYYKILTYIGNTTYQNLESIQSYLRQEYPSLDKYKRSNTIEISFSEELKSVYFLPPWVFDYDASFYSDQDEISNQFKSIDDKDIPEIDDISLFSNDIAQDYFILFIYSNRNLPESWLNSLSYWEKLLFDILYRQDDSRLTLPYLYIGILKHFLFMLSNNGDNNEYNPKKYFQILGSRNPCKIYDPLGIIYDFCKTLQILWDNRNTTKIDEFRIFEFHGKGWLKGKRSKEENKWTTILTYCGGHLKSKNNAPCGNFPLILGREEVCQCGKLICLGTKENYCGFCGEVWNQDLATKVLCPEAIKRKESQR